MREEQILINKIAHLESVNDQLESELANIDQLLRSTGFPNGIESAKEVALQVLEEGWE
jgi:hypothetical protein